jgi:hypothetical protein
MIKYRESPDTPKGNTPKKVEYETFYTAAKRVSVKALPPHPLKEQVPVGLFRLKEAISNRELTTGKGFNYHFTITGEGNFSAVHFTPIRKDKYFDFFPPRIVDDISRVKGKITGTKSFQYHIIPKEPGIHVLRKYFEWVYFNTHTHRYDTLSSSISVNVTGESRKNTTIAFKELSPVYRNMMHESSRLRDTQTETRVQLIANVCLSVMLLATVVLLFIRR